MQRQPDGLVPIGEALADLPGPIQAIRKTPPPAPWAGTRGAGARLWSQPLGLVLLEGVTEWAERIGRKHER